MTEAQYQEALRDSNVQYWLIGLNFKLQITNKTRSETLSRRVWASDTEEKAEAATA
jgi:hypothetical protein